MPQDHRVQYGSERTSPRGAKKSSDLSLGGFEKMSTKRKELKAAKVEQDDPRGPLLKVQKGDEEPKVVYKSHFKGKKWDGYRVI